MPAKQAIATIALLTGCLAVAAQQTSQVQLKIEPTNRTLTVSAEDRVTVDPDVAILHVGFETQPKDAKGAYAAGAATSNCDCECTQASGRSRELDPQRIAEDEQRLRPAAQIHCCNSSGR